MNLKSSAWLFVCIVSALLSHAQSTKIFDKDSLKGFDEAAARASVLSEGYTEEEYPVKMETLKREYINNTYNLNRPSAYSLGRFLQENRPAATGCTNMDFEASIPAPVTASNQIAGWTITKGFNSYPNITTGPNATVTPYYPGFSGTPNSCNLITCCPVPPSHSELIDCGGGYVDSQIGAQYPIFSVFGSGITNTTAAVVNPQIMAPLYGKNVLRLNDGLTGDFSIERASRTFTVTQQNTLYQVAFISVLGPGHGCCDAPVFSIRFTNTATNSLIGCATLSVAALSGACTAFIPGLPYYIGGSGAVYSPANTANVIYNRWKIFSADLSSYIGQTIALDIVVTDCSAGGHLGKLYIDAQCSELKINIDDHDMYLDSVINYTACENSVIKAPNDFGVYNWDGPSGFTSTNSTITATLAGTYTLTLRNLPSFCPIQKIINLSFHPKITSLTSNANPQCFGDEPVLTASGFTACTWAHSGATSNTVIVTPTVATTYTVSGTDVNGCVSTLTLTQDFTECTGIGERTYNTKHFVIYPNPNNGEFTLSCETDLKKGELVLETTLGQIVYRQPVSKGNNQVITKGLSEGIYQYTILDHKQVIAAGKLKIE